MVITITDKAADQVKEMMQGEEEGVRLRFGIKGGGCSGLSYSLGFEHDVNDDLDNMYDINGIPVVIFNQDEPIIEGTTIDYKQNMMGGGFAIENPNAIVSCGCGSSFKAKNREGTPENC
ncbi:HesB/IscA family protein [Virgibacillus ihumii]|uniref:HesB/IscA family protein n=1 Tax=Virgibacillus ihumii TaxID=2686091 RepID=UPI00157D3DEB|nr:iron-sulfur cluster assembly accessory protein [Virgibacillus ihumii]